MARVNVTVDDQLLKELRKASGQKTNADAMRAAAKEMVRVAKLRVALDELQEEAAKGDFFWPNYLEEIRPHLARGARRNRVSAHEKRMSRSGSAGRTR